MKRIRLSAGTAQLAAWGTAAGGSEQLVELRQTKHEAWLTVATPLRVARVSAAPLPGDGDAGPLAIRCRDLAAVGDEPATLAILSGELAAVIPHSGVPHTCAIVQSQVADGTSVIDEAEAEAASLFEKRVAVVPRDFLQQAADAAEAIGSTAVEIAVAARSGLVMATAVAQGSTAVMVVASDGRRPVERPASPAGASELRFTVKGCGDSRGSRPKRREVLSWEGDVPW